jgi:hypothetical protein
VAVPLQKTASGWKPVVDESFEGHVFCFLPLPILSDLPVHINGYFCVTSSRRHLYEPYWKDKTDPRAVWNNALLKDPVQKAYTNMLVDLTKVAPSCGASIYELWPSLREGLFSALTQSFLEMVTLDGGPAVFPSNAEWVAFSHCKILEKYFWGSLVARAATKTLQFFFENTQISVVDMPSKIEELLSEMGLKRQLDAHML